MAIPEQQEGTLGAGPLEVHASERTVLADGRPLRLTVREFQILAALASRPDRVIGRRELYRLVWDREMRHADRSVDVYVSKVRSKLEGALPHWSYIDTHIGFGYCWSPHPLKSVD
jgi:DNA-binding response OmpR family regulator